MVRTDTAGINAHIFRHGKFFRLVIQRRQGLIQQQRVAIARVLAQRPEIILADEPTASLDPKTSRQVMEDLKMLNEKFDMTVVANLHSIELAKDFGHRVIGVRAGEIVYDGKMEDTPQIVFDNIYNGGKGKEED